MIGIDPQNSPGYQTRHGVGCSIGNAGYRRVSGLFDPLTGSRALRPVNSRLDQVVARGERIVNDWIDTGRRGEKTSQVLLQQTTDEVVGEVVDMLASRPEIRELVQQQSMGMVDELTDELQGRAAAVEYPPGADRLFADTWLKERHHAHTDHTPP